MLSSVIEPVSVWRFREFLARSSLLASDIYFDGVIANATRECLLDVYYSKKSQSWLPKMLARTTKDCQSRMDLLTSVA